MRGITLIETLIYLALYSIIIGGTLVSVFYMVQSEQRSQTHAQIAQEAVFVLGKLRYWVEQSTHIDAPDDIAQKLELSYDDSTLAISVIDGELSADTKGSVQSLTADTVRVEAFTVERLDTDAVMIYVTLAATSSSGQSVSEEFEQYANVSR